MIRIGIVGPVTPDTFADNLVSSLRAMGHEPVSLGTAHPMPRSGLGLNAVSMLSRFTTVADQWQKKLVRAANESNVEVTITTQGSLLPSTVRSLRSGGRKIALWYPDHVANLERQLMLISPYDAIFFKDRLLVDHLVDLTEAPVHYLPEACNPAWHHSSERLEIDPVIVVAGNLYPSRVLLLDRLHRAGVPLRLHSSAGGWPRWMKGISIQSLPVLPEVHRDEKARTFRRAAAVLNNLHPAEMNGMNCRLFEAAGCGAVVLAESRPVLRELFEPDIEILDFRTFDELMDRINYALHEVDITTKIGDAATIRAHKEHTYSIRLTELFQILRLSL